MCASVTSARWPASPLDRTEFRLRLPLLHDHLELLEGSSGRRDQGSHERTQRDRLASVQAVDKEDELVVLAADRVEVFLPGLAGALPGHEQGDTSARVLGIKLQTGR